MMVFLSIYIFGFILNWYTIHSIVVENTQNIEKQAYLFIISPILVKFFYNMINQIFNGKNSIGIIC
jgi:hypothetical protein